MGRSETNLMFIKGKYGHRRTKCEHMLITAVTLKLIALKKNEIRNNINEIDEIVG